MPGRSKCYPFIPNTCWYRSTSPKLNAEAVNRSVTFGWSLHNKSKVLSALRTLRDQFERKHASNDSAMGSGTLSSSS
jgi:hypothetical protein